MKIKSERHYPSGVIVTGTATRIAGYCAYGPADAAPLFEPPFPTTRGVWVQGECHPDSRLVCAIRVSARITSGPHRGEPAMRPVRLVLKPGKLMRGDTTNPATQIPMEPASSRADRRPVQRPRSGCAWNASTPRASCRQPRGYSTRPASGGRPLRSRLPAAFVTCPGEPGRSGRDPSRRGPYRYDPGARAPATIEVNDRGSLTRCSFRVGARALRPRTRLRRGPGYPPGLSPRFWYGRAEPVRRSSTGPLR